MFAVIHAGKPLLELALSFPAAIFLGLLAYRVGSIRPLVVLHMATAAVVAMAAAR